MYQGSKEKYWVAFLVAFSFSPTLYVLLMGHITTLHLLGVIGFLYFITRPAPDQRSSDLAAGASIALISIKPQLLLLFGLAVLIWVIARRRWFVFLGGIASVVLLSIIPMILDPRVFNHFWRAVSSYPVGIWASPALGTVLRRAIGYEIEWLQLVPTLLGMVWLIFYWRRHAGKWDWLEQSPVLILASFVTSPYMWPYDMVVLLLPVLKVFIDLVPSGDRRSLILMTVLFLAISLVTFYHFLFVHNYYYLFWLAPTYLGWYLLGEWFADRTSPPPIATNTYAAGPPVHP
jgi:hypothetical protein